jgi:hypothetical protein
MDTETVANLVWKALNAGNVGEAESVVEPSDDDNYMAYKFVRLLSCVNVNFV